MWYGYLADVVVGIHLLYVAFVVVGLFLIFLGGCLGWNWVRNRWFRSIHFLAIAYVAYEGIMDLRCPLTIWEEQLRELAGQPFHGESFMAWLIHSILFFEASEDVFTMIYVSFATVVLATLIFIPPRWRKVVAHDLTSDTTPIPQE